MEIPSLKNLMNYDADSRTSPATPGLLNIYTLSYVYIISFRHHRGDGAPASPHLEEDWMVDWLIDWLIDGLIDWLIN